MKSYSLSWLERGRVIKKAEVKAKRIFNEILNKVAEEMIEERINSSIKSSDECLLEFHQPSFKKSLLDWLDRNGDCESNGS